MFHLFFFSALSLRSRIRSLFALIEGHTRKRVPDRGTTRNSYSRHYLTFSPDELLIDHAIYRFDRLLRCCNSANESVQAIWPSCLENTDASRASRNRVHYRGDSVREIIDYPRNNAR